MLNIEIIAIGSQKNMTFQQLTQTYLRQMRLYAKVHIHTLKSLPFRSIADQSRIRTQETDLLLHAMSKSSFKILLSEHGSLSTSLEFAQQITKWSEHETQTISFLISGPLGHDRKLEQMVDHTFSLSPLTFPHEMAQMILLEQLYRACTIREGKTYHY